MYNKITLQCRISLEGFLKDADYWINSTDQLLTSRAMFWYGDSNHYQYNDTLKGLINFIMKPEIEGDFYCGKLSNETVRSGPKTILGT